jgi:phosphatidylethanolamine-binding protein
MPNNKSVNTALSLIESDKSKILGLTIGKHNVVPGQFIPRAGKHKTMSISFKLYTQ